MDEITKKEEPEVIIEGLWIRACDACGEETLANSDIPLFYCDECFPIADALRRRIAAVTPEFQSLDTEFGLQGENTFIPGSGL